MRVAEVAEVAEVVAGSERFAYRPPGIFRRACWYFWLWVGVFCVLWIFRKEIWAVRRQLRLPPWLTGKRNAGGPA